MNEEFTTVPDIPRDRWSRPMIIPAGGGRPVAYTRCTTYVSALEDTYNLGLWQQRMVAKGLATRPDLLLSASSLVSDMDGNKARLNRLCDDAREAAAASAAATTGTALHALTERIDRGLDVGVIPDQYRPHIDAYQAATSDLEAVHVEQFTVLDELRIGGTPDRILRIPGEDGLVIGDVKTGNIEYGAGKIAMQMAVYAHSVIYRPDGSRTPIDGLRTDKGLIIHLDAATGTCELVWVDLNAGWEGVQLCTQVRGWRKRKGLTTPCTTATPASKPSSQADQAAGAALTNAIATAATVDDLTQLWIQAGQAGLWTDSHTAAAAARKAALTQATVRATA